MKPGVSKVVRAGAAVALGVVAAGAAGAAQGGDAAAQTPPDDSPPGATTTAAGPALTEPVPTTAAPPATPAPAATVPTTTSPSSGAVPPAPTAKTSPITPRPATGASKSAAGRRSGSPTEPRPKTQPRPDPAPFTLPPALAGFILPASPAQLPAGDAAWPIISGLGFPAFLLPVYQAAGARYGVPWQVLAAINQAETNFGHNVAVSSAGAVGWMQFMPATWARYGVDATGDGRADPDNPIDAIYAAANYLQATGAGQDLATAVFAYNHAGWYVDDVLSQAAAIAALPDDLTGSLGLLANGRFPVNGPATIAPPSALGARAGIIAPAGTAVRAARDSRIEEIGVDNEGGYVVLRDDAGNVVRYSQLAGSAPAITAGPAGTTGAPGASGGAIAPAPAGTTGTPGASGGAIAPAPAVAAAIEFITVSVRLPQLLPPNRSAPRRVPLMTIRMTVPRLADAPPHLLSAPAAIANSRAAQPAPAAAAQAAPAALPSGVRRILLAARSRRSASLSARTGPSAARPARLVAKVPQLADKPAQVTRPASGGPELKAGASVAAGQVIGRIAAPAPGARARFGMTVRPSGMSEPIDARALLRAWQLLHRSVGKTPARTATFRPGAADNADAVLSRLLRESPAQLGQRVLGDARISIYPCGRDDIAAGVVDPRVLAVLEYLADSGLNPTVSSLRCGHSRLTASGNVSEHSSGDAIDISAINGTPILGNQGAGSITETTIRRLLELPAALAPHQIISLMTVAGAANTLAMADHADHIHVGFSPLGATPQELDRSGRRLSSTQWGLLTRHLDAQRNPIVPFAPGTHAIAPPAAPPNDPTDE